MFHVSQNNKRFSICLNVKHFHLLDPEAIDFVLYYFILILHDPIEATAVSVVIYKAAEHLIMSLKTAVLNVREYCEIILQTDKIYLGHALHSDYGPMIACGNENPGDLEAITVQDT